MQTQLGNAKSYVHFSSQQPDRGSDLTEEGQNGIEAKWQKYRSLLIQNAYVLAVSFVPSLKWLAEVLTDCLLCWQACIRCGATSTPLWRPEVRSGPKVLCNACGVQVLHPVKSNRAMPDSNFTAAAGHQSHIGKTAKEVCCSSASMPNCEQSKWHCVKGQKSSHMAIPESSKRQKRHSAAEGDVLISPAQKQYLDVERQYGMSGSKIVRWIITDCTIDDTRDFDQVTHAQSFIDECWAFISTDFR